MAGEKLEAALAGSVPLAEALFYRNSAPHTTAERAMGVSDPIINNPEITPYVGNFPECFAIPAVSGFVGDYISHQGQKRNSPTLQKIGEYFPEITTTAISTYFVLGETVLPQILPGSADPKDIPAVLLSALAGYALAKIGRKSRLSERIGSLFQSTAR